jgi:hypothetical protein
MRNVGYTMETAVADIIDNSIAAQASEIHIFHKCEDGIPCLAILDNGLGMTREELVEAMRPGGFGPLQKRQPEDLGRFGLGLKTASFSQCRRLTVISHRERGQNTAGQWDLDQMEDRWSLRLLNTQIDEIPFADRLNETPGTLVIWEKLDRLCTSEADHSIVRDDFLRQVELVRRHLSLVFHRYLEEKRTAALKIFINYEPIVPFDPYFRGYDATQRLPEERIFVRDTCVSVKPFIIPHYSKLKAVDYDALRELGGPAATQGFYVYRNKRLLSWGDWFRLRKAKTEASGLARVMIDIPNDLDDLWSLDIKKSSVSPPEVVRRELSRIINRITEHSTRTYTNRGQRFTTKKYSLWTREESNQGVRYRVNKEQVLVEAFINALPETGQREFFALLGVLERQLPTEAIYNDKLGGNLEMKHDSPPVEPGHCQTIIALLRRQGLSEDEIQKITEALTE